MQTTCATRPTHPNRLTVPFNPKVPGSRPGRPTNKRNAVDMAHFATNGLKLGVPVRSVKTAHCSQLFARSAHCSWASHGQDPLVHLSPLTRLDRNSTCSAWQMPPECT